MKVHRIETEGLLEQLARGNQGGQANETVRAIYGKRVPDVIPVTLLCLDGFAHFEFHGTRRIFRIPRAAFMALLR